MLIKKGKTEKKAGIVGLERLDKDIIRARILVEDGPEIVLTITFDELNQMRQAQQKSVRAMADAPSKKEVL